MAEKLASHRSLGPRSVPERGAQLTVVSFHNNLLYLLDPVSDIIYTTKVESRYVAIPEEEEVRDERATAVSPQVFAQPGEPGAAGSRPDQCRTAVGQPYEPWELPAESEPGEGNTKPGNLGEDECYDDRIFNTRQQQDDHSGPTAEAQGPPAGGADQVRR